MTRTVSAVLIDVGGTLWPSNWPPRDTDEREVISRIIGVLETLFYADALRIVEEIQAELRTQGPVDRPDPIIARHLGAAGLPDDAHTARDVRAAMCVPALGRIELLPGAHELLRLGRARGLRCVLLSNTRLRDRALYRQDFVGLAEDDHIDDYVTSVDVGVRKPDPAMFEEAARRAGVPLRECLMIGDDAADDVVPAIALGLAALLVNANDVEPDAVPERAAVVPDLRSAPAAVDAILVGDLPRRFA